MSKCKAQLLSLKCMATSYFPYREVGTAWEQLTSFPRSVYVQEHSHYHVSSEYCYHVSFEYHQCAQTCWHCMGNLLTITAFREVYRYRNTTTIMTLPLSIFCMSSPTWGSLSASYCSALSGISYQIEIRLIFTVNFWLLSEIVTPMVPTQHIVWV